MLMRRFMVGQSSASPLSYAPALHLRPPPPAGVLGLLPLFACLARMAATPPRTLSTSASSWSTTLRTRLAGGPAGKLDSPIGGPRPLPAPPLPLEGKRPSTLAAAALLPSSPAPSVVAGDGGRSAKGTVAGRAGCMGIKPAPALLLLLPGRLPKPGDDERPLREPFGDPGGSQAVLLAALPDPGRGGRAPALASGSGRLLLPLLLPSGAAPSAAGGLPDRPMPLLPGTLSCSPPLPALVVVGRRAPGRSRPALGGRASAMGRDAVSP